MERIAKYEIAALRSEVRPIVESELKKRGYDDFLKAVEVQKKQLSKEKLRDYKAKIKSLDCPICGSSDADLMAGYKREVRSYLFFTNYRVTRVIACPVCVRAELKKARIRNIIWGWWSIPGFIKTIQALDDQYQDEKQWKKVSEGILNGFVKKNIGEISLRQNNEKELMEFIGYRNSH